MRAPPPLTTYVFQLALLATSPRSLRKYRDKKTLNLIKSRLSLSARLSRERREILSFCRPQHSLPSQQLIYHLIVKRHLVVSHQAVMRFVEDMEKDGQAFAMFREQ